MSVYKHMIPDVARALALLRYRPIIHLATDDYEQMACVMMNAFLKVAEDSASSGESNLYSERFVDLQIWDGKKAAWDELLSPEKKTVLYLGADTKGSLSEKQTAYLLDYAERMLQQYLFNGSFAPKHCAVVFGSRLKLPAMLEPYTQYVKLPALETKDFRALLSEQCPGEKWDDDTVRWYQNRFAGFTERDVRAVLAQIAYGEKQNRYDKLKMRETAEKFIVREKQKRLERHGKLQCLEVPQSPTNGVASVENWMKVQKKNILRTDDAKPDDLTKGMVLLGLPGTGKSLTAKTVARVLELPLVKLEMSRVLGSLVGESEKGMDEVMEDLQIAGAPCVLWIDEVEKAFSGADGKSGDSGVTQRLFGKLLEFMQEMKKTVFIVATANDISKLPPEFTRFGRIDAIFTMMLPCYLECRDIMKHHLERHFIGVDDKLAGEMVEICMGSEELPRFMTGSDINHLAKNLAIEMGGLPGVRTTVDQQEAKAKMEDVVNRYGTSVDARVPKTLRLAAQGYCTVMEKQHIAANGGGVISKDRFCAGAVVKKNMEPYDHAKEKKMDPLCLKKPNQFTHKYDERLFHWIGMYMDRELSREL
ncbi:MAG: AAA family ATPase [Oscillospiraceae bacterium]|nr:AAA family ATPase [Oscillospiraceae bacterium]